MLKKLKNKLDKIFDVSSYGYVVNKWIFRSAFIILLVLILIIIKIDGWDVVLHGSNYIYCEDTQGCLNPYGMVCQGEPVGNMYNNLINCSPQILSYGDSIGNKPSWLSRSFVVISLVIMFFAFLINHYIYNKNFKVNKK